MDIGGLDARARQVRGDARQQLGIAHAAAAGDHPRGTRLVRLQRAGDRGRRQFQQGSLHVRRRFASTQSRRHPVQVELFAAGALGRRQREPGLVEQPFQQSAVDLAAGGERAVGIERLAGVAQAPGVEQRVGRAGVEAAHVALPRQQGVVADPAEVEHGPILVCRTQQRGVEGRYQRCAVAAGGDIAAAEVGHGGDPGALGDHVAVADLQGERRVAVRAVAQGLPVRTDRRDLRGRHAGFVEQGQRRIGKRAGDLHVEPPQFVQRGQLAALAERDQALAQRRCPGVGTRRAQAQAGRAGAIGEFDQRGVDAVGAGAGDQAKEEVRHARSVAGTRGGGDGGSRHQ